MRRLTTAIQQADTKLQGEIAKVVQAMRNDYHSRALAQEQGLTAALEQQKDEALAEPQGHQPRTPQRDATTNQQIFSSLLQRTKETGISGELKTSNIRIIDPAEVPRRPTSPNTQNNLLIAIFGGATLAIGLSFFFEYLDNRIKTPDEIKQYLRLPFLGMVPALFDQNIESPIISNSVPSNFIESFRNVRTNVLFSSAEEGGRSLVVTSTGPGKVRPRLPPTSLLPWLNQACRPLIDGDLRKPQGPDTVAAEAGAGALKCPGRDVQVYLVRAGQQHTGPGGFYRPARILLIRPSSSGRSASATS